MIQINTAMTKLADENIAQQFELNILNNFIDKYLPLKFQNQLSKLFKSTFFMCDDVGLLYDRYENADRKIFERLHETIFRDKGRANLLGEIEDMNLEVAERQDLLEQHKHFHRQD